MSNSFSSSKSNYLDQPCERCGSPKKILKTWTEELKTSLGSSTVEVSQSVCTNKECQAEFEKVLAQETEKVEARKAAKAAAEELRKKNIAKTIRERKKVALTIK